MTMLRWLSNGRVLMGLLALLCAIGARLSVPLPERSLDLHFTYTAHEAYSLIAMYGETGRRAYWSNELYDLGFLFTYTLIFVGWGIRSFEKKTGRVTGRLCVLILTLPGFFDFVETVGVLDILAQYPREQVFVEQVISVCTPLKWSIGTLVLIWLIFSEFRTKRSV